ncbi:hypothetical protein H0W80_03115 [Candidatus Saccharibacteria bacterium]|nr:hypothetical protein [Candidatus Saccharibacteria bacterium]
MKVLYEECVGLFDAYISCLEKEKMMIDNTQHEPLKLICMSGRVSFSIIEFDYTASQKLNCINPPVMGIVLGHKDDEITQSPVQIIIGKVVKEMKRADHLYVFSPRTLQLFGVTSYREGHIRSIDSKPKQNLQETDATELTKLVKSGYIL